MKRREIHTFPFVISRLRRVIRKFSFVASRKRRVLHTFSFVTREEVLGAKMKAMKINF